MSLVAFLIGLPMLQSEVAFTAVSSISVIGLYITYGLVIFFKLFLAHRSVLISGVTVHPVCFWAAQKSYSGTAGMMSYIAACNFAAVVTLLTLYMPRGQHFSFGSVQLGWLLQDIQAWTLLPRQDCVAHCQYHCPDLCPLHHRGFHHAHCFPSDINFSQLGTSRRGHCPNLDLWVLAAALLGRPALVQRTPCSTGAC